MKDTIFDLIEDDIPEGKEGYFKIAEHAPEPKDNSFLNSVADYAKTALKGTVEGISRLGSIMGPLPSNKSQQEQFEQQTENLNKLLPTQDDFGQRALRRGLSQAPTALSFPGSTIATLPRAMAAGFLGEGAKDLGAPEWAQTAAELTAYIGPDITKKLLEKGSNKKIIESARRFGMTDEQITPLLQSEFKQKWLSKISSRRGKTEEVLKESKKGLSEAYDYVRQSMGKSNPISEKAKTSLLKEMTSVVEEMPSAVRELIKKDAQKLVNKPITGDSLMNFYADINHYLSGKTKQLARLKDPIKKAISSISPQAGKDFQLVNDLYSKYHKIAARLKPNLTTDIVGASEALGTLFALTTGEYPLLVKLATEKTGRKIAQQMLLNPKFQQIGNKIVDAVNQNKFNIVKKLSESYAFLLKDIEPNLSEKLSELNEHELKDFFKHRQEK